MIANFRFLTLLALVAIAKEHPKPFKHYEIG